MRRLKSLFQTLFIVIVCGFLAFVFFDSIGPGNIIENAVSLFKALALFPLQILALGVFLLILWLIGLFIKAAISTLIEFIRHQPKVK